MAGNVEKLRRLRTRFLLIFWVGIPAVLAIVYFAFFHGKSEPVPVDPATAPAAVAAPKTAP